MKDGADTTNITEQLTDAGVRRFLKWVNSVDRICRTQSGVGCTRLVSNRTVVCAYGRRLDPDEAASIFHHWAHLGHVPSWTGDPHEWALRPGAPCTLSDNTPQHITITSPQLHTPIRLEATEEEMQMMCQTLHASGIKEFHIHVEKMEDKENE